MTSNVSQALLARCNECKDKDIQFFSSAYTYFNFFIIIILVPMVSIFGLMSNVVNMFIYTRPRLAVHTSSFYLAALACSDFLVVFTGILVIFMDSARSYLLHISDSLLSAILGVLPLAYVVQSCSIYFTVALAIDGYCKNVLKSHWCTVGCAKKTIIAIMLSCMIYNTPRLMMFEILDCNSYIRPNNGTKPLPQQLKRMCPTNLFLESNTIYNVYMYSALIVVGPFLLMLSLNLLVIKHTRTTNVSSGTEKATVMVVGLFLACNILAVVTNILENFLTTTLETINYMVDASNFLVIINSSFNFFIYLLFDPEYKHQFVQIFCGFLTTTEHFNGNLQHLNGLRDSNQLGDSQDNEMIVVVDPNSPDIAGNGDRAAENAIMSIPLLERLI